MRQQIQLNSLLWTMLILAFVTACSSKYHNSTNKNQIEEIRTWENFSEALVARSSQAQEKTEYIIQNLPDTYYSSYDYYGDKLSQPSESDQQANLEYLANLPTLQPNNIEVVQVEIKQKSQDGTCEIDVAYPQIRGLANLALESQLNAKLKDAFLAPAAHKDSFTPRPFNAESCAKKLREYATEFYSGPEPETRRLTYALVFDYVVTLNKGNILSIRDDGYLGFFHPAAHPTKFRAWVTVDLESGEVYECVDLFDPDPEWMNQYRGDHCTMPFHLTENAFVIAPNSSHAGFWATTEIPLVLLRNLIDPNGPLRIFLPPEE